MKCKDKGLTLIEVLVVVTILSVLALSIYTVFKSGIDAWSRSEARLEIYQNARVTLDQISREVVGAFSDSASGAKLAGTPGAAEADFDTLEFITGFADSIYKVRYRLAASSKIPAKKSLERSYIDYSETPGAGYSAPYTADHVIEFVPATIEAAVSNIKFKYLPVMPTPAGMNDWNTNAVTTWPPDALSEYKLPEAIKIILTLRDANNKDHVFETIVYLPNSEE